MLGIGIDRCKKNLLTWGKELGHYLVGSRHFRQGSDVIRFMWQCGGWAVKSLKEGIPSEQQSITRRETGEIFIGATRM